MFGTEAQKQKSLELIKIMKGYDAKNLPEIVNQIKRFEETLLNDYKAEEMAPVLLGASVARYSLAYWNDRMDAGTLGNGRTNGFWRTMFIAMADTLGAMRGAQVGSLLGPIGTVAGAVTIGVVTSATAAYRLDKLRE